MLACNVVFDILDSNIIKATSAYLFETLSDPDMQLLVDHLQGTGVREGHSLRISAILLSLLVVINGERRQAYSRTLLILEALLSTTRGKWESDIWDWDYELYRNITKRCNGLYANLIYLERRLDVAIGLTDFLLESLTYCQERTSSHVLKKKDFLESQKIYVKHFWIRNASNEVNCTRWVACKNATRTCYQL